MPHGLRCIDPQRVFKSYRFSARRKRLMQLYPGHMFTPHMMRGGFAGSFGTIILQISDNVNFAVTYFGIM